MVFTTKRATRLSVGSSRKADAAEAAHEAATAALGGADDPVFALVFSTDRYDHAALAGAMSEALGPTPWAGCCTAGVFAGDGPMMTQGLVVGLLSSREARVGIGVGGAVGLDGAAAGRKAVFEALSGLPRRSPDRHRAIIVLPDALTGNAAGVVRGAAAEAGSGIVWAGGGAGDNLRFLRTAQYANGHALQDHVVAIAIDLPSPACAGIRHGWRPYGPPAMVTRSVTAQQEPGSGKETGRPGALETAPRG